jgi:purine-nucleoside phosphorylase
MSRPGKDDQPDYHNSAAVMELATIAAASLRRRSRLRPALAIVLGSGYDQLAKRCTKVLEVAYEEIPGFPAARVTGHEGRLVLGLLADVPVFVLSGRSHYYEGLPLEEVTFPMRVLAAYGIETVVLANAAGGITRGLKSGMFMSIRDHINLMGANPLRGWSAAKPGAFVDLTGAYDPKLIKLMARAAKLAKVPLTEGVYLAVSGPSYETPAEIAAFGRLGTNAIGMSTVPDVIVARQCGMRVAGLSCITNVAAGLSGKAISHAEVLAVGASVQEQAGRLLENFVKLHAQAA